MVKISPKIQKNINRYLNKNTVRAKYDRNMDAALASGLISISEIINFRNAQPHDIGILAASLIIYLKSFKTAMKHLIKLQPIRKRAIKIKKASKHV